MEVGDLVMNKTRYLGQVFVVIESRKLTGGLAPCDWGYKQRQHIRCVRVGDGYKTRWCQASTWQVLA